MFVAVPTQHGPAGHRRDREVVVAVDAILTWHEAYERHTIVTLRDGRRVTVELAAADLEALIVRASDGAAVLRPNTPTPEERARLMAHRS